MYKAAMYVRTNILPRMENKRVLDEYLHLVQWKPNGGDRIMDIGCGPGDVTVQILLPKCPDSISELVGTDRSTAAIQYAKSHYQHAKVRYDVLDISTNVLPNVYYEHFDHVFSFFCLHWVHDQRQAMGNIFKLLQPGGDVLLLYLANHAVMEVFSKVAEQPLWQPYLGDARQYLSAHHNVQDVEGTVHAVLQEVGFQNITCHCRRRAFTYDNLNDYTDAMIAVNTCIGLVPAHLKEKYLSEFVEELKTQVHTNGWISGTTGKVVNSYELIHIYAKKPQ